MAETKKKWAKSSEQLQQNFLNTMARYPVEHKKMFGYPCCFVNGYMMTGLHEENWILRLPDADREAFFAKEGGEVFAPMQGRVMREYVAVPESFRNDPEKLLPWIEISLAYLQSLPPKPKKKKKG